MIFSEVIIRCPLYPDEVGVTFKTVSTQSEPSIYKGTQIRFQFGVFKKRATNAEVEEFYNTASGFNGAPRLRVRTDNANGAVVMDSSTGGAVTSVNQAEIELENWADGTASQIEIFFPESDTSIASGTYFVSLTGPDGDVLGISSLTVIDGGNGSSASPAPPVDTYYTKSEVASLVSSFWKTGFNDVGQTFVIISQNGLKGRKIGVDNDGNPTDEIIDL